MYHVDMGGQPGGPYSADQIRRRAPGRSRPPRWCGPPAWLRAAANTVPALAALFAAPPPLLPNVGDALHSMPGALADMSPRPSPGPPPPPVPGPPPVPPPPPVSAAAGSAASFRSTGAAASAARRSDRPGPHVPTTQLGAGLPAQHRTDPHLPVPGVRRRTGLRHCLPEAEVPSVLQPPRPGRLGPAGPGA